MINNKKLLLGEVVLLKFPFTNGQSHKRRPALVLLDTDDKDFIACRVTSKLYNTEYDFEIEDWKHCGLKLQSIIRLHKIASLDKNLVEETMGTINKDLQDKIKNKFMDLLG